MNVPTNITRRAMFAGIGALASTAALARVADTSSASAPAGDALTHQLIGAYFVMSPGQRTDFRRLMNTQGLSDMAEALDRAVPLPRPTTLEGLFEQFDHDARAIDPRITKTWVLTDETMKGPKEERLTGISFERVGKPFARKRGGRA